MPTLNKFRAMVKKRGLRRTCTLDEIKKDTSFLHPPPNGGWGWVVVLAAATHCLLVGGFHSAFGVYMLPLLDTFKSSNSQIAWIGSISYAFIMIFGPVSGKLLVKYGAIKVALIGNLVTIGGLVWSSYTHNLPMLFFTHGIIVGVGSSLAYTPEYVKNRCCFFLQMKLAGDLGIPLEKASYIMVGLGVSSMISCLLFGKICDIENIDRLYINQASILSVGVVYFIIPHCTSFGALVATCSLLGFFDAGNYVLLPVLTFDLMGAEKMPVAWGFMMAVNAISCFGPPFAGAMYDMYGSYTIGFVVTGVCNIAAAGILALIPWLQREAIQATKNYINASICVITNTIVPWQSPSPSLGVRSV
ncbi:Monocarboxylate transporter 10, partial [Ophiophagus hannah]